MKRITGLIIACIVLCMANATASQTLEDFKEEAKNILPSRDTSYTQEEISDRFTPILLDNLKSLFTQSLNALFSQDPIQPNIWQCLHGKMAYGQTLNDEDYQRKALFQTLAGYTNKIAEVDPELVPMITEDCCKNCFADQQ